MPTGRPHADIAAPPGRVMRSSAASPVVALDQRSRAPWESGESYRPRIDFRTPVVFSIPTPGGGEIYMGSSGIPLPGAGTFYMGATSDQVRAEVELPMSAGTWSQLRMRVGQAPGSGNTWRYTVMVNGVDTAMVCTIVGTARFGSFTGTPIITAADDALVIRRDAVVTGLPPPDTTHNWTAIFDPS